MFTTKSSKIAFDCGWYRVRQDEIVLPNGQDGQYNVVEKDPAVFIVPVTAQGEIVLIRQFRYAIQDWVWEIPAGAFKPGQTEMEAARDELREEVGGRSDEWIRLGQYFLSPAYVPQVEVHFVAFDVELGDTDHEPGEQITVHPTPYIEVYEKLTSGFFTSMATTFALFLAKEQIYNRFQ